MNDSNLKDSKMMTSLNTNSPLMYIIVIGFHHKKGCQVEFVYPCNQHIFKSLSTEKNDNNNDLYKLPKNWKHLPSLALPDGSHNYDSDYIYFHLEDHDENEKLNENKERLTLLKPNQTIFGISCYRQINASEIINKDSDVTRNTLQKSVCILSRQPIYSNLKLKLVTITNAYFDQRDFNKTDILVKSFNSLTHSFDYNSSLFNDLSLSKNNSNNNKSLTSNYFIGLSLSDLVLRYQHKILVLFKLILLQKKCLFQLKPVSNLSNTIMSLVSLFPDLYEKNGLNYCAGYFDSIDLVNCELERKNSKNNIQTSNNSDTRSSSSSILFSQSDNFLLSNNQNSTIGTMKQKRKKSKKRKVLSFSHKKNIPSSNNSNNNISFNDNNNDTKSINGSSINSNGNKAKTSLFNAFSNNTQRMFSFKNQNNKNLNYNNNNNEHKNEDNSIIIAEEYNNDNSFNNSKHDIKLSRSMSENNNKLSNLDENNGNSNTNLSNMIKSRVSGVFNNIWSSSSNNNNFQQQQQQDDNTSTPISKTKKKASIPQIVQTDTTSNSYEMDLSELLEIDLGMPFNLFNEFNILHPYLSLYYLEYFSTINKMNTKLYCTTALMMNMMKDNSNNSNNKNNDNDSEIQNDSNNINEPGSGIGSVTASSTTSEPTQFGYTIGATNILFKQRLYDDLDAFIDENDIDLKNNEQLKKQLQLTTADLRFVDYIIKNVQSFQKSSTSQVSSNNSTPTLLSFKKTNSFINNEKSPNNNNNNSLLNFSSDESSFQSSPQHLQGANCEGSDDWIRLNFKWYLYSMFGSILKEDLFNLIKNELDHIYFTNNSNSNSDTNYSSTSSGSQTSLANEIIDIDDYIDKCNNQNDEQQFEKSSQSKNHRKSLNNLIVSNGDRKHSSTSTSTTSTLSSSKYYLMQSNSQSDFRDDFNSNYINELKKTQFFKQWLEANKSKLEKTLLKFDVKSLELQLQQMNSNSNNNELNNVNNKFQLLLSQLQELEKLKLNHPFSGQIGVNDLKLRLNVLFTTTESGRKLNKALIEGGKLMNNTGKAVGDALSQAKSTFNSFLSNWSANNSPMPSNQNVNPVQSLFMNKSSKVINQED